MRLRSFIKDKLFLIILLSAAVFTSILFMNMYGAAVAVCAYVGVSVGAATFAALTVEFAVKKRFYGRMLATLIDLDEKYLISEMLEYPGFEEGRILEQILSETERSRFENVASVRHSVDEYREYLEMWIHEVKIPIATADMIIKNNPGEMGVRLRKELARIDDYTQQALFYARSNTLDKDYLIVKCSARELISGVVKKNKTALITDKVNVDISGDDADIYTDSKWMAFILNQIVDNSIKYMDGCGDKRLEFVVNENKENVTISVNDTGCGISVAELPRIFDKGFTGSNGRLDGRKATGIGLYLCRKLCEKMNVGIMAQSQEGVGTSVSLVFPKGSFVRV